MKSVLYSLAAGIAAAGVLLAAPGAGAEENTGDDGGGFTIEDVAFLAGHWVGAEEIGRPEEGWFAPAEGVMTAVFRWPNAGGRYVVELLTISEEEDGVVFRFKHFDPDMTAWEKEFPNTYRLSRVENGCATFTGAEVNPGVPANMQYCLTEDDRLIFRGGSEGENIAKAQFTLEFTRKP